MQPISGFQWKRVSGTGAGTTVVKASPTVWEGIVIGQDKEGTITFYDHASGTTATSLMTVMDNTGGTEPQFIKLGIRCRNGLVAELGGTTDMLVIYS